MINITLHIEYLLRHHDCVIIPGIGAFIAVNTPARYDEDTDTFLPPMRSVMFNAAICSDDGLLASSYARLSGCKYDQAHNDLTRDIETLSNALTLYHSVKLGALGTLFQADDGRLSFMPFLSPEAMMQKLGCIPVSLSPHHPNSTDNTPEHCIQDQLTTIHSDKYYYIPVHKTFVRVAASIVAFLAVAVGLLTYPFANHIKTVEASVMPIEKILRLHSSASSKTESHKEVLTIDTIPTPPTEIKKQNNFNLVVGAFNTLQEAEKFIQYSSNTNGTSDSLSISQRGRHYLVVYASSDDRQQILSLLNSKDIANQYKGAWIWELRK